MRLNTMKPAQGAKKSGTRLGRGIGSGLGKTCGRGHKGQHARAGGYHKIGFEGGQMPLQRRLPKFGFTSQKSLYTAEVRLSDLVKVKAETIDIRALKEANIISKNMKRVKVIASGKIDKVLHLRGLAITKGAKSAIEKAGGTIEA